MNQINWRCRVFRYMRHAVEIAGRRNRANPDIDHSVQRIKHRHWVVVARPTTATPAVRRRRAARNIPAERG